MILARNEFQKRGWLTYTELMRISPTIEWRNLIKAFLCYNISIVFSYALGFLTIAGAFIVASHVPGSLLSKTAVVSTTTTNITSPLDLMDCCCNATPSVHSHKNLPIDNRQQPDQMAGGHDPSSTGYGDLISNTIELLKRRLEETEPRDYEPRNEKESCPYSSDKNFKTFDTIVSLLAVPAAFKHRPVANQSTLFNYKTQKWSEGRQENSWSFWLQKKLI